MTIPFLGMTSLMLNGSKWRTVATHAPDVPWNSAKMPLTSIDQLTVPCRKILICERVGLNLKYSLPQFFVGCGLREAQGS